MPHRASGFVQNLSMQSGFSGQQITLATKQVFTTGFRLPFGYPKSALYYFYTLLG